MKRIIAIGLCAALCLGLVPPALAEGDTPAIQYAAITATAPDYSDAALVTEGLETWEAAFAVEGCVFVVIYSLDTEGTPPTLNADIELSQTDPGLILSDVIISGSARAEAGLFMLGDASVVWGNVTLSGSSESGDPLSALTDVSDAADVLAAIDGSKIRHTYTDTEEEETVVVRMLFAYDLVIDSGVTVTVVAPEGDWHHIVTVEHSLTVKNGGVLTADDGQELVLRSGATVTGLELYEEDGEGGYRVFNLMGDADETFVFNTNAVFDPEVTGLWVRSVGGGEPGPGPIVEPLEITVTAGENGSLSFNGKDVPTGQSDIIAGPGDELIITPDPSYAVESVTMSIPPYGDADTMDIMRNLSYNGDGTFSLTLRDVWEGMRLEIIFAHVNADDIDEILSKSYAVLNGSEEQLTAALAREFGYLGYAVDTSEIAITAGPTAIENGYGTFSFTVALGEKTSAATGYVVEQFSDVIFKYRGTKGGASMDEIRVARAEDGMSGEFGAPAMDEGTLEIFGPYYTRIAGWTSPDVRDAFDDDNSTPDKLAIKHAFYRVQLHITNAYGDDPFLDQSLNWFMFDLIQDDALCVEVSASSDQGEQRTFQWELNRYAQLTTGGYASEVYFANDEVSLSLPSSGIGGADNLSMIPGEFPGYKVIEKGDIYTVAFLSNFYNEITLDLTINGTENRQLTIRRVGVNIADYSSPYQDIVFHGTQFGTHIDYSDGMNYRIYATYYIPDSGTAAPYGLFVTYTWADGATTTEIVTGPAQTPFFLQGENAPGGGFEDGVFIYERSANACDYLLYAGPNAARAPRRVSVTVLRDEPGAETFGGVSFGSGAGVTWTRGQ